MSQKIKPVPSPRIFGDAGASVSKGNVDIDGTKGDDLFVYTMGAHGKYKAEYEGDAGTDTLQLNFTAAQWANSKVQADVAHFKAFLAAPAPAHGEREFEFTAFKLAVEGFEKLKVMVDGVQVYPSSGMVILGADGVGGDFVGGAGNDTIYYQQWRVRYQQHLRRGRQRCFDGRLHERLHDYREQQFLGGDGNDFMKGGDSTAFFASTYNLFYYGVGADTMVGGSASNNGHVQNTFHLDNWSADAVIVQGNRLNASGIPVRAKV